MKTCDESVFIYETNVTIAADKLGLPQTNERFVVPYLADHLLKIQNVLQLIRMSIVMASHWTFVKLQDFQSKTLRILQMSL